MIGIPVVMLRELSVAPVFAYLGGIFSLMAAICISAEAIGVTIAQGARDAGSSDKRVVSRVDVGLDRAHRMAKWRPKPKNQIIASTEFDTELAAFDLARRMDLAQDFAASRLKEIEVVAAEPVEAVPPSARPEIVLRSPVSVRTASAPAVAGWVKRAPRMQKVRTEEPVARIIERSLRSDI